MFVAATTNPAATGKTQFAHTLRLWRTDVAERLHTAGSLLGSLLATDQIELEWMIRVRDASSTLLELARGARHPMVRHPALWLTDLLGQLERPRRFVWEAQGAHGHASAATKEDLEMVVSDLNELHVALIELIRQLAQPEVVAGGAA